MSSDQGKNTELEQQAPTPEKQKIESTELTDAEMEKVSGGGMRDRRGYAAGHFLLTIDSQPTVVKSVDPQLPGLTPKP